MLRDVECLRSCDVPRVISVSSYHSVLIRSLRTHTSHIHFIYLGSLSCHQSRHYAHRPASLAGLLICVSQFELSTCWRCDGETVEFDLLTTRLQRTICRFITGISMYQFIPWTYLSCSRSPLLSYRTTVTHMSLFSLRLSGENRPSLQSTTIHYVASVM